MVQGFVKQMFRDKKFAFIDYDGVLYFFHAHDFNGHWEDLLADYYDNRVKIRVEFEKGMAEKGPRASHVHRIDWPNEG
jgi:hypothetical protein